MAELARRQWEIATPHGDIPISVVGEGDRSLLLAHGAGAGQRHPWMQALATKLAERGVEVTSFDYAYVAAGRKAPDRLPKLLDVHEAVWLDLRERADNAVLGGKSMGGRVAGHLVADGRADAAAIVFYGYPLVAMGKTEPRPTDHLEGLAIPQLFVSGDRDRLGPIDLVRTVARTVPRGETVEIPDGDHSLKPRKASGRTLDDSLEVAADETVAWMDRFSGTPYAEGDTGPTPRGR